MKGKHSGESWPKHPEESQRMNCNKRCLRNRNKEKVWIFYAELSGIAATSNLKGQQRKIERDPFNFNMKNTGRPE